MAKPVRTALPLVSFIVPTLNRGRYVMRAVASCLALDAVDAEIEVVVIDSQSDDGSFEALVQTYGAEPRVRLLQNAGGSGPTRSWIEGAQAARGDYISFVWSDDYLSPQFLKLMLPHLSAGREIALGTGAIRDIDDDRPLPAGTRAEIQFFEPAALIAAYFDPMKKEHARLPVSPCAALVTRRALEGWISALDTWSDATELRRTLHWRRAIGPDLMLILEALLLSTKPVLFTSTPMAQFSWHEKSITVSSAMVPYQSGYWLARLWALRSAPSQKAFRRMASETIAFGALLWIIATLAGGRAGVEAGAIRAEIAELEAEASRRGETWAVFLGALGALPGLLIWSTRRALRSRRAEINQGAA